MGEQNYRLIGPHAGEGLAPGDFSGPQIANPYKRQTPIVNFYAPGTIVQQLNAAVRQHTFHKNVIPIDPMLASEDFAFYSRKIPSMFYFLGAKSTTSDPFFLHHPKMQVNEECIAPGATFLSEAALESVTRLS